MPWHRIWLLALTRPRADAYHELAALPGVKASRAYLWVVLAGSFDFLVSNAVHFFSESFQSSHAVAGWSDANPAASLIWVFVFPLGGGALLLGFMLLVAMINAAARSLGGTGSHAQLAFVLGALAAPFSIITAILLPFSLLPYLGICVGLFALAIGLYLSGLQVPAIMGVHQLGLGRALAALILPILVLSPLAVCILAAF